MTDDEVCSSRGKEDLPETLRSHCMAGKYQYEVRDPKTGIDCPCAFGVFLVERPHTTVRFPAVLSRQADAFPMLEEVTMDKDDVLLTSCPKTGRHFCAEILEMLTRGEAKHVTMPNCWIEFDPYDSILQNCQSKRRILKSHLTLGQLPPKFRRSDTKVIIPIRNMKDVFVSFYHHMLGENRAMGSSEKRPWEDYFNYLLHSESVLYEGPFKWYADLWENYRDDPNVLIVFYEELVINPERVIGQMEKHIGLTCSQEFIKDVTEATRFESLKKANYEDEMNIRKHFGENFSFYRRGTIGDWKNLFTVAQNEEFHRVFDEWNRERQIPFIYEYPNTSA